MTAWFSAVKVVHVVTWEQLLFYFTPLLMSEEHLKWESKRGDLCFSPNQQQKTQGHFCHHQGSVKYPSMDVNTSDCWFFSDRAFDWIPSCAASPLGAGKREGVIQIIKLVRRGWKIVGITTNIPRLCGSFLIESVSVPSPGRYTHSPLCSRQTIDSPHEL